MVDPAVIASSSVANRHPKTQCQFEICGEGALPRFSLINPVPTLHISPKSKKGGRMLPASLEFARLLPDRCSVKAVTVKNESPFPCQFEVRLLEEPTDASTPCFGFGQEMGVCANVLDPAAHQKSSILAATRRVKVPTRMHERTATPFTTITWANAAIAGDTVRDDPATGRNVILYNVEAEEEFQIMVKCAPKLSGVHYAEVQIAAVDNQFETLTVELKGEGYTDDVSIPDLEEVLGFSLVSTGSEKSLDTDRSSVSLSRASRPSSKKSKTL